MRLKTLMQQSGGTLSDLFGVPVHLLDTNPENIRLDTPELRDHIRILANSILAQGFLRSRPLTIRQAGERLIVTDGNCRLMAVRLAIEEGAEIKTLPCISEAPGTNDADRTCNMLLANSGLQHTPLEYVAAIKRLMSYGWTDTEIARKLGRSRQWLSNLLELAEAPAEVQALIADGTVSPTEARRIVRQEGAGAAAKITAAKVETGRAHVTARHLNPPVVVPIMGVEPVVVEVPRVESTTQPPDALYAAIKAATWVCKLFGTDDPVGQRELHEEVDALRAALRSLRESGHPVAIEVGASVLEAVA